MKALFTTIVCMLGLIAVEPARSAEPITISDIEAVNIIKTIQGYMEQKDNRLEIFDRKKGKIVNVGVDKIVTDNPDCIVFPEEGKLAICVECTEKPAGKDNLGDVQNDEKGDQYVLWFIMQRGSQVSTRVLDTVIKSVNGVEMYQWSQNADGKWEATLIEKPAEATAE